MDGIDQFSGRVEVCVNEDWASICRDGFGQADAERACEMAGFSREGNEDVGIFLCM